MNTNNKNKTIYREIINGLIQGRISHQQRSKQNLRTQIEAATKGKNIKIDIKESNIQF